MEETIIAAVDFSTADTCAGFFHESGRIIDQKLVISSASFQQVIQRCRQVMELALHTSTQTCNAESWRYFMLMSIFSSLTGIFSLLSLYLYFKICEKIKKKKSLEKETHMQRQQQGTSA